MSPGVGNKRQAGRRTHFTTEIHRKRGFIIQMYIFEFLHTTYNFIQGRLHVQLIDNKND